MTETNSRPPIPLGALLLIFVGIVFLLNNFGIIPWEVWSILWRGWPLVLIFIGLEAIVGKTKAGNIILFVVLLSFLGFILWAILNPKSLNLNFEQKYNTQGERFFIRRD